MKDLLAWGLVCSGTCWALACAGQEELRGGGSEAGATSADSNAGASSVGVAGSATGDAGTSSDGRNRNAAGDAGAGSGGRKRSAAGDAGTSSNGTSTGGFGAGGAATGGRATTGGVAAGGAGAGGTAAGGAPAGGVAAGGAAAGGRVMGSAATAGVAGGGAAAGGTAMGGAATGGVAGGTGGHATGGGPGLSCDTVTPCGGDVVGTWTATSSCLDVTGELDLSPLGVTCDAAPITGSLEVTGTWTARADGKYEDTTTTWGEVAFRLAAECLPAFGTTTCQSVSGDLLALGYSSVACTDAPSGGCDCSATVEQNGGIGVVSSSLSSSGTYSTANNAVMTSDDAQYAYCVSGNEMTMGPKGTKNGAVSGTVAMEKRENGACAAVTPCGGDVVGTWTVTSSCLNVIGELDLSPMGIGCVSAPVTGSLEVTGTWTARADGTYVDETSTSGQQQFTLAPECLAVSGTTTTCQRISPVLYALGYSSVECADAASGGCDCTGTVEQTGGLGMVSWTPSPSGSYTTSAKKLTTSDDTEYAYCVSGNTLTMAPLGGSTGTLSGTVLLEGE